MQNTAQLIHNYMFLSGTQDCPAMFSVVLHRVKNEEGWEHKFHVWKKLDNFLQLWAYGTPP